MDAPITPQEFEAFSAVRRAVLLLQASSGRALVENGDITRAQFEILFVLGQHPEGLRMHELADLLIISRSGLTYQIGRLERGGLVARSTAQDNERAVVARLTGVGRERVEELQQRHFAFIRRHFFSPMNDEEIAVITRLFTRIGDGLEAERET